MAHATMLRKIGILNRKEQMAIIKGLDEIGAEIADEKCVWKPELEDVHMNIEAELTRRVPAGAKLHTARSRNDQVALDVRLWLRAEIVDLLKEIRGLQSALVELGRKNAAVIIPGYTHLHRAQPVYFAHHPLASFEILDREADRPTAWLPWPTDRPPARATPAIGREPRGGGRSWHDCEAGARKAIGPASPLVSARMISATYLIETTTVSVQKNSDSTPRMLACVTGTWPLTKTSLMAYRTLVPMSP